MADGTVLQDTLDTTLGRSMFNEILPQDLGYVDRSIPEPVPSAIVFLTRILILLWNVMQPFSYASSAIKAMGYKYSTRAAMTVSISDMTVPPQKPEMIKNDVVVLIKTIKKCLCQLLISCFPSLDNLVVTLLIGDPTHLVVLCNLVNSCLSLLNLSRSSSWLVCVDLWQTQLVRQSNFLLNQTSVKVLTYWSTSFPLMG